MTMRKAAPDLEFITRLKRWAIMGIFADDDLMDLFVLKGGNALDIVHRLGSRASVDIDLSVAKDIDPLTVTDVEAKLHRSLNLVFGENGYVAFDLEANPRPRQISAEMEDFWGGYRVTFKLIATEKHRLIGDDLERLRREALMIGGEGKLQIDISKHEFVQGKEAIDLDGYQIFVYPPAMIVAEKLRAICQQMPEYREIVRTNVRARARDFLDIHATVEQFALDLGQPEFQELVFSVFAAKRVPTGLLGRIKETKTFHEPDFTSVQATMHAKTKLRDFGFYFDYVCGLAESLHRLRDI